MAKAPRGLVPGQVSGLHGKAGEPAKIKPGWAHRHGCVECGLRYDDACDTPDENGRCQKCRRNGAYAERPFWIVNGDPADCCKQPGACRVMTYDERMKYTCASAIPWHQCQTCKRTHPYNPEGAGQ